MSYYDGQPVEDEEQQGTDPAGAVRNAKNFVQRVEEARNRAEQAARAARTGAEVTTGVSMEAINEAQAAADALETASGAAGEAAGAAAEGGEAAAGASGGAIGAAVAAAKEALDIATDPEKQRQIIDNAVLLAVLAIMISMYIAALPSTIWEGVVAYYKAVEQYIEDCETAYAESRAEDYGTAKESLAKALNAVINKVAGDIKAVFVDSGAQDDSDGDVYDETDLGVTATKDDLTAVLKRKIKATKNKFKGRASEIYDKMEGDIWVSGEFALQYIDDAADLLHSEYDGEYISLVLPATTDFVDWDLQYLDMSYRNCIKLLALYTTMTDDDANNTDTLKYMQWLGYPNASDILRMFTGDTNYSLYNDHEAVVKVLGQKYRFTPWKGTFLPMYLQEEMTQNTDENADYSGYMCSAVDLMLVVTAPDEIEPTVELVPYQTISVTGDTMDILGGFISIPTVSVQEETAMMAYVSYEVTVSAYVRPTEQIAQLAGLYSGGQETMSDILEDDHYSDVLAYYNQMLEQQAQQETAEETDDGNVLEDVASFFLNGWANSWKSTFGTGEEE